MGRQLKETLVGVFIVAGVIVFVLLYTWLSGRLGFRNTYEVAVYFDDVSGLRVGDPVTVFGIEKGKIKSLQIDGDSVRAVIALDRDIILPDDSKIAIRSVNYLGTDRYVKINPGKDKEVSSIFHGVNETLDLESMATQFDSLIIAFKNLKLPDFDKALTQLSSSINKNIQGLSEMVKGPTDKIEGLIIRLDSLSMLLEGNGTIGKLLKSDDLYEEIRGTNRSLKDLIEDIKENPQKYIPPVKIF